MELLSERQHAGQPVQPFQRRHGRYHYAFFVNIAPSRPRGVFDDIQTLEYERASVQDISGGGIRLVSQLSVSVASSVDLCISLDGRTVETVGRVIERIPMHGGFGYRIVFDQLCPVQQDTLSDWIEQAVQSRGMVAG